MACCYRFNYHPTHHAQVIGSSALTGKCHQHQPCRGRKQKISYRACRSEYIPLNIYKYKFTALSQYYGCCWPCEWRYFRPQAGYCVFLECPCRSSRWIVGILNSSHKWGLLLAPCLRTRMNTVIYLQAASQWYCNVKCGLILVSTEANKGYRIYPILKRCLSHPKTFPQL